jgi:nucleoside-diphosphate-sugar epimerase
MRVVVTGGSGRLGQYVIRELFTHGHAISTLDVVKPRECLCPTYTIDLEKFVPLLDHLQNAEAVIHLARIRFPYTETGFNPVTQRWEFGDVAGDAERFQRNVAITNNVLKAAQACGIKRIVCGSSLAVYGLYYPTTELLPDYLPVDEDHPRRPQDPYGLTKLIGEKLCDAVAQRTQAQIASLRFAGVYTEAHRTMLMERQKNPTIRGTGALWSYIDARDGARACRLAMEAKLTGHRAFNICAPKTFADISTRELIAKYLPGVKDLRDRLEGCDSAYSIARARNELGFGSLCSLVD